MAKGIYDRTNAKTLQSEKAKQRWKERGDELRESLAKRDMSNAGRKPTFQKFFRPCLVCETKFSVINTAQAERKKFCCRACYYQHQKVLLSADEHRRKMSEFFKNVDKSYMKTQAYSDAARNPETPEYTRYKNAVHKLSEKIYVDNIETINPDKHPRTLCGVDGGWQLDHIKTVRECFDAGTTPEEASKLENLRMLPWKENLMRNYVDNL